MYLVANSTKIGDLISPQISSGHFCTECWFALVFNDKILLNVNEFSLKVETYIFSLFGLR